MCGVAVGVVTTPCRDIGFAGNLIRRAFEGRMIREMNSEYSESARRSQLSCLTLLTGYTRASVTYILEDGCETEFSLAFDRFDEFPRDSFRVPAAHHTLVLSMAADLGGYQVIPWVLSAASCLGPTWFRGGSSLAFEQITARPRSLVDLANDPELRFRPLGIDVRYWSECRRFWDDGSGILPLGIPDHEARRIMGLGVDEATFRLHDLIVDSSEEAPSP